MFVFHYHALYLVYFGDVVSFHYFIIIIIIIVVVFVSVIVTIIADKRRQLLTQLGGSGITSNPNTVYVLMPQHAFLHRGEGRRHINVRDHVALFFSVRSSLTRLYPPHRDHFPYLRSKRWIVAQ
jgi:hypothetical protein